MAALSLTPEYYPSCHPLTKLSLIMSYTSGLMLPFNPIPPIPPVSSSAIILSSKIARLSLFSSAQKMSGLFSNFCQNLGEYGLSETTYMKNESFIVSVKDCFSCDSTWSSFQVKFEAADSLLNDSTYDLREDNDSYRSVLLPLLFYFLIKLR